MDHALHLLGQLLLLFLTIQFGVELLKHGVVWVISFDDSHVADHASANRITLVRSLNCEQFRLVINPVTLRELVRVSGEL